MEISGVVSKIIFRNSNNQYVVFAVECDDGNDETMFGNLTGIEEGMYVTAKGEYVDNKQYGMQFSVTEYEVSMPDDLLSMERYLSSGAIKGIGEIMAKKIIRKFGMDTFRIIGEEPERLAEVKGISERKANDIAVQFVEKQEMREALMFLSKYGISPSLSVKIYNEYGYKMYAIIKQNPYRLAEDIDGVGFKTADLIAMRGGIGVQSEYRIRAALIYTLSQAVGLGHIYLPKDKLINWTIALLNKSQANITSAGYDDGYSRDVSVELAEVQLNNLLMEKKIVINELEQELAVYSVSNYEKEKNTARMLMEIKSYKVTSRSKLDSDIRAIEKEENIEFDEMQKEAVRQAAENGVLVITGGPGTGKTTTINAIIRYFENEGAQILLAAPTGRAAKRMTEATGHMAQTIHRLLELSGGVSDEENVSVAHFERNSANPLEADVVIIDEMSMVDQPIMNALVSAVLPGTHLILVGDKDQLPSVGPGNVLKDIISSGCIPVVALKRIFRQEKGSLIVENAHRINKGETVIIDNKSKDFFYKRKSSAFEVLNEVGLMLSKKLPGYVGCSSTDIQVLTPMRTGALGVENLNRHLQEMLNPQTPDKMEKETGDGTVLRVGDKVMQIRNNYKLSWTIYKNPGHFVVEEGMGIFNGDMGIIKDIDSYNEEVTVLFDDDKEVKYPYNMLDELELSYAITIHKSQGSEYPAVVLPILTGPQILMNRNLLYTAVTRAKNCVVIVGSKDMVDAMVGNNIEQRRYSSLDVRLKEV